MEMTYNMIIYINSAYYTLTCLPSNSVWDSRLLTAAWIVWICIETADKTASSRRLNSSKQPQAPHFTSPINIRPIDFTSIPYTNKQSNKFCKLFLSSIRSSLRPESDNENLVVKNIILRVKSMMYFITFVRIIKNCKRLSFTGRALIVLHLTLPDTCYEWMQRRDNNYIVFISSDIRVQQFAWTSISHS